VFVEETLNSNDMTPVRFLHSLVQQRNDLDCFVMTALYRTPCGLIGIVFI